MRKLAFFTRIAWIHIRRGGQRVLVALLCIAFGVMSLVSMTLVSGSFDRVMVLEPGEQIGGDISMVRQEEAAITAGHTAGLDQLVTSGEIDRYTLIAYTSNLVYRLEGSSKLYFTSAGMGIDPDLYPLAGRLVLGEPGNTGLRTLLQEPGDVVITRDLAMESGLQVGDSLILSDLKVGTPVTARVRGIASDTPNHQGGKVYYNHVTAQRLANQAPAVNTALALAPDPAALAKQLAGMGWEAYPAAVTAERDHQARDLFDMLLKGAGILGLLVGGIGIANTMQVLLRRRQCEVAIWKALGYQENELHALFAIEAALLGMSGSLLGAALGGVVSVKLLQLFSATTNLLISWALAPGPVLLGIVAGLLTTIIFAMWAIVGASRARPVALLRNEPVDGGRLTWLKAAGLALVLSIPFTAVTSLVMGSLLKGVGILLFALVGLVVLGGLLGGLLWVIVRLMPLRSMPLVNMARVSLRRRGLALIFAMIALFTGIAALALGLVVTENAQITMQEHTIELKGDNIQVIAPASQLEEVRQAVMAQHVEWFAYSTAASARSIQVVGGEQAALPPLLVGRSEPREYTVEGAPWGSRIDGVYVYKGMGVPTGSQVEVVMVDGSRHILEVVGAYDLNRDLSIMPTDLGLLAPVDLVDRLAQPERVTFMIRSAEGRVARTSEALGLALPRATVIDLVAYASRYTQVYHNLFVLAISMAGLALLAGVLLVANSVSLAMLDRRYEMAVLKAVGYARRHILTTLAVEYSLVGAIASLAALVAVQVFLIVVAMLNELAGDLLVLTPQAAVFIWICGVGLTLLTVLGVTWHPTRVSPVIILNERT